MIIYKNTEFLRFQILMLLEKIVLKLSIWVCLDFAETQNSLILMARISTQATKIQIFDLNWQLFPCLLTVIMSFLYLITFFIC